jgi:YVTN family beta-propeller protein
MFPIRLRTTPFKFGTRRITCKLVYNLLMLPLSAGIVAGADTPANALLVLNKGDNALAIVDPVSRQVVARVPAGHDIHEVIASADGRLAFVSNYGGGHTLSVIDLVGQKALPAVDLGALRSPHGLSLAEGKVYFTAEGSRVIGSYDPATEKIDWVFGLGQDRTHMIVVSKDGKKIFTSNVNSDTISIIEPGSGPNAPGRGPWPRGPGGPLPGGPGNGNPPPGAPGPPPDGPRDSGPQGGPGGPPPGGFPPGGPGGGGWNAANIPVGQGPEGFDLSPDGKEIWAANSHDGTVSIIDVGKKAVAQTLTVPTRSANRLKFTLDGKFVLISDLGGDGLVVLDAMSRKELKRIPLGGGAAGILMEPGDSRAYVAVGSANSVVIIDLKTLEVIGRIETGRGPDGLGWAARS